jgi:2-C-methyl-D-erythritol 4-phosphate cytidylyltransferase
MRISAVIPAAGVGKRFSAKMKKQFFELNGKPILYYTLLALNKAYPFDEFIVGATADDFPVIEELAKEAGIANLQLSQGGAERVDTVLNAIQLATGDYVAVHDAVRPFVDKITVSNVINLAIKFGAAIPTLPARDTIKVVKDGYIEQTLDRDHIYMAHTPQVFNREQLIEAIMKAKADNIPLTDEASAFEYAGYRVKVSPSSPDNIKITQFEDIELAEVLLKKYV